MSPSGNRTTESKTPSHHARMATAVQAARLAAQPEPPRRYSTVVIGTDTESCEVLRQYLFAYGIETRTATSVKDAASIALARGPIVFCDLDSLHLWRGMLRQVLAAWSDARVVFVLRLCDDNSWIDMLEAGAFDVLLKPVRAADVRWVARGALLSAQAVPRG